MNAGVDGLALELCECTHSDPAGHSMAIETLAKRVRTLVHSNQLCSDKRRLDSVPLHFHTEKGARTHKGVGVFFAPSFAYYKWSMT